MNALTILASCSVLLAALCIHVSEGACFAGYGCYDTETNKTYTEGERWRTPSCTSCRCSSNKQYVKLCLEYQKLTKSPKKSGFTAILVEDNDPEDMIKEVEITMEESVNFECPTWNANAYQNHRLSYHFVSYVVKTLEYSCCTPGYPVQYPRPCESRLNKQTCQYEFFMKGTNQPCTARGTFSMVGK